MHSYFRYFFFALLFLISDFPVFAQEYGNRHYQIEDGLPGSIVYSITMDKQGRILFGTNQGIGIFNGKEFRNIGNKEGLFENEVLLLYNDSKNRTWVTTFGNTLYCYSDGKLNVAYHDTTGILNHTKFTTEDKSGNIWIVGRSLMKLTGEKFSKIETINDSQNIYFYERNGKGYFISVRGTTEMDKQNKSVYHENSLLHYYDGSFKWKNKVYFYYQNYIDEYLEFSPNLFRANKLSSINTIINRIKVDQFENLWILTNGNGALRVDGITGDTTRFIPGHSVSDVLVDDDRNIWLSTLGEGVYKIYFPLVTWYTKSGGFITDHFLSVAPDDKNGVFAGDRNGNIYRINGNKLKKFRYTPAEISNRILDIAPLDINTFLTATDEGLIRFNLNSGESLKIIDTLKSFKFIKKSKNGNLLTGTYKYGLEIGNTHPYKLFKIWNKRTLGMEVANDDQYYLASLDGLYLVERKSPRVGAVPFFSGRDRINDVAADESGTVWIATDNEGLYFHSNDNLIHINESTGLSGNSCKHIFISNNGDVFVSTNKGVSRIRILNRISHQYMINKYNIDNGLPSNETYQCTVVDQKLWVATGRGLAAINIYPGSKDKNPVIAINSLATADSNYHTGAKIEIPISNKFIDLNFEGISLTGGMNLIFKYRIPGIDKVWNFTKSNTIRYASLAPGNYIFQIAAVNTENHLESKPAEIRFTVLTPWWRTRTFILLAALLSLTLSTIVFRWRLKRLQVRAELRNRVLSAEIKSIRSQMDPHFIFNALNSIQGYILKNEKLLANQYLASFSRLMRMVLENSNQSFVTIQQEMEFLELYLNLEQLRLNHKFTYSIECDDSINSELTEIPGMILQPLVENAVIHGVSQKSENGRILVKFETNVEKILCIVEDDGNGFYNLAADNKSEKNSVHQSFGFRAIEERIKLINSLGRFKIRFRVSKSEYLDPGNGTRVEIEIEDSTD